MTEHRFDLGFDEAHYRQLIRVFGLWDMPQVERFQVAVATQVMALAQRGRAWDLLIDAREFAVQPPAVADRFEALLVAGRQFNTGYTAILVASMLSKMQAERVLRHERLRAFLDEASAAAWLVERRAAHDAG